MSGKTHILTDFLIKLHFEGMVDSNWTIAAVLEKKLLPLPFTFALSGQINHVKHSTKVGAGLYLG